MLPHAVQTVRKLPHERIAAALSKGSLPEDWRRLNVQRLKSFSAVIATALITAFALLAFTAVRAIQHTRRPLGPLVLLVIVLIFLPVLSARWYARRTADQAVRQLGYHPDDLNEPLTIDDYAELIARE